MTTGVDGVTVPSSRAAAIVMIFAVEPGSKTSEKALLSSWAPFFPTSVFGLNVGYDATLSRSPDRASMMTTVPALALVSLIRWASAFCAYHWREALIVRCTSRPSTAGVVLLSPAGIAVPSWPCS